MNSLARPQPIRPDHDASLFDSGVPALDDWLRRRAVANEATGASRTFVSVAEGRIAAYHSLAAAAIVHGEATSKARRNMPNPVPAVLIGRLALDRAWQGRGLGGDLLRDAVLRATAAAAAIGVRALLVHAMSDDAKRFYERYGFRESPIDPMTLMVTLDEVRGLT